MLLSMFRVCGCVIVSLRVCIVINTKDALGQDFAISHYALALIFILGVHDMQQALHKVEPADYKHAVNDLPN